MPNRNSSSVAILSVVSKFAVLLILACAQRSTTVAIVPAAAQQTPGTATSARTLFYDSFDSVKSEWQQVSGIWESRTDQGYLIQKSDDPRQLNALRYIQTPRVLDGTIETLVRVNPNRPQMMDPNNPNDQELMRALRYTMGAGIVFRMKDPQNYYMFRLGGEEGAVLGKMVNGQWFEMCEARVRDFLDGSRIGFRADNWYRLRVDAYQNVLTAFINDEPVCRSTDSTHSIGSVGVVTFKVPADFDYVRVTDKGIESRAQ